MVPQLVFPAKGTWMAVRLKYSRFTLLKRGVRRVLLPPVDVFV